MAELEPLTPRDSETTIEPIDGGLLRVKYAGRLEYKLHLDSGNLQEFTYR